MSRKIFTKISIVINLLLLVITCELVTQAILNAPAELTATVISPIQINLSWIELSANASGQKIERRKNEEYRFTEIASINASRESYEDTNLEPLTTYSYRVFPYRIGYTSPKSNIVEAKTDIFTSPSGLTAEVVTPVSIILRWVDNTDWEDGYKIERHLGGEYQQIVNIESVDTQTYQDEDALPDKNYSYIVYAYINTNLGERLSPSNIVEATTPPLNPPVNLIATPLSSTQINLSWGDSTEYEEGYRIERRVYGEVDFELIDLIGVGGSNYQYIDTGLSHNTQYQYRVSAYYRDYFSDYSSVTLVTTFIGAAIQGVVLYNGQTVTNYSTEGAYFWVRNENTGTAVTVTPEYNSVDGSWRISGMEAGSYGISVSIDDALPYDGRKFPGDYDGWNAPIEVPPGVTEVIRNISCEKTIHLTAPVDNGMTVGDITDPYAEYAQGVVFQWDSIAEAVSYQVRVERVQSSPYSYQGTERDTRIAATQIALSVDANAANEHYEFHLYAYNATDVMVGKLMVVYANGYGWDYRFRVL